MSETPTYHRVLHGVHQPDDVGSSSQVFQDFDFSLDLFLLDGLQATYQEPENKILTTRNKIYAENERDSRFKIKIFYF